MPVINIEDLTEKDKLKMEVDQLKKEVTLERMMVRGYSPYSLEGTAWKSIKSSYCVLSILEQLNVLTIKMFVTNTIRDKERQELNLFQE